MVGKHGNRHCMLMIIPGQLIWTSIQKIRDEIYACMWHRERRAWNFVESGNTSAIYKSTDGGDTWKKLPAKGTGFPQDEGIGRIGVAVYAANPQIIYATLDNQNHRPDTASKKNRYLKICTE